MGKNTNSKGAHKRGGAYWNEGTKSNHFGELNCTFNQNFYFIIVYTF